jgi:polyferredoxin
VPGFVVYAICATVIVTLVSPVVVVSTISLCKRQFKNANLLIEKHKKHAHYIPIVASIGGVSGYFFLRPFFAHSSYFTVMILFIALLSTLSLFFVMSATVCYFKVYLIRKYCPRLKRRLS